MLRNIGAASELYWDSMRLEEQTDEYGVRVAERLRAQVREVESLNALRALQTRADEHAAGLAWMMGQQGGVGMTLPPDVSSDPIFERWSRKKSGACPCTSRGRAKRAEVGFDGVIA